MLTNEQKIEILGQILSPRWGSLFVRERDILLERHNLNLAAAREYVNEHGTQPTDPALVKALQDHNTAQKDIQLAERMHGTPILMPLPKKIYKITFANARQ